MRKITKIVIHHSASARDTTTIADITRWHLEKKYDGIGYHRVIEGDGEVKMGRDDERIGAHAYGANTSTLGICLTGNFDKEKPDPRQIEALIQTLAVLCKRHGLKASSIIGHRDTIATSCPGKYLFEQLPAIRQRVAGYLVK